MRRRRDAGRQRSVAADNCGNAQWVTAQHRKEGEEEAAMQL